MRLHRWLDKRFPGPDGKAEEINGGGRCPTYLFRWVLLSFEDVKIYVHKIVGSDWSRDLHDHPKRFISIGIWGSYLEERQDGTTRRYRAPWVRTFPAEHRHRLTTPWGTCWTIVIVLKTVRAWGFWPEEGFVPWRKYVSERGGAADRARDC